MNVQVFTSSPRDRDISVSRWMATHLSAGLAEAGATVETHDLNAHEIHPCIGCFSCWSLTPGKCILTDDMTKTLFDKFMQADLVILASPVYYFQLNGTMVNFVDRLLPNNLPGTDRKIGLSAHPLRKAYPPLVLVAASFFEDEDVFTAISSWFTRAFGKSAVARIFRTAAQSVCHHHNYATLTRDIEGALVRAGGELATTGHVSAQTQAVITQPLPDHGVWDRETDLIWETCQGKKITIQTFIQNGSLLYPRRLSSFLEMMALAYSPPAQPRPPSVVQFIFLDHEEKCCWMSLGGEKFLGNVGQMEKPALTIQTPYTLWIDILHKVIDIRKALSTSMLRISGNLAVFSQMGQYFQANTGGENH